MRENNMRDNRAEQAVDVAESGRATDTTLGHLTPGELVVPLDVLQDPEIAQLMQMAFQKAGVDINEFIVGNPANKINPETGMPEFFSFKKLLGPLGAIAGFALGGPMGAAIGGGLGGGLGGGSKGALQGAALGGLGGLGASGLSGLFGGGAALGGASGGSSLGGLGSLFGGLGGGGGGGGLSSALGGGGFSSPLGVGASLFSQYRTDKAQSKAIDKLLAGNRAQLDNLDTFDPTKVAEDPGYKFNVAEGQNALDRASSARGNFYSGAALKAASDYNQQLANNYGRDYYDRWARKASAQNDIYGSDANIAAMKLMLRNNNVNQGISSIFG